jgi:hypothetical protein
MSVSTPLLTSEEKFEEMKKDFDRKQSEKLAGDEEKTKEELLIESETTIVKIPEHAAFTSNKTTLSPFDLSCLGRSIPMIWCYKDTINDDILLSSLSKLLVMYPMVSGRYDGSVPPSWIACNNAGIPVRVTTWKDENDSVDVAMDYLPSSNSDNNTHTIFPMSAHSPFVPDKKGMDPDIMSPAVPIMKVKVIHYPKGGTSIGVLCQHGVMDAESIISFMTNWSRLYNERGLNPLPNHNRCIVIGDNNVSGGRNDSDGSTKTIDITPSTDSISEWSTTSTFHSVPLKDKKPPEFVVQIPNIMGKSPVTCCVPITQIQCNTWKKNINTDELTKKGLFCSTDDIITAKIWKALVAIRMKQVGPLQDDQKTTISRAYNVRKRMKPKLDSGYFGNFTTGIRTSMLVCDIIKMKPREIALRLRSDLQNVMTEMIFARGIWLKEQYEQSRSVTPVMDDKAMTFLISSWNFPWENVSFESAPVSFDHGCHVPIVAVIVPRLHLDGMNVYVSGPNEDDMNNFATSLFEE